jgi:hypothetical protein
MNEIKVGQKYTENNSEYHGGRVMQIVKEPDFHGWSYAFVDVYGEINSVFFSIKTNQLLERFTLIK